MKIPLRIVRHGFDAVPDLLVHFEDHRLTRCHLPVVWGQMEDHFDERIIRVEFWVRLLLNQWVNHPNQKKPGVDKSFADYLAWQKEVDEIGEEAYLLRHLLCDEAKVNQVPYRPYLDLLFQKYPGHLPSIYQQILTAKTEYDSRLIAEMIAKGPFPMNDQIGWLFRGIKHRKPEHRVAAIEALEYLDTRRFAATWLELMEPCFKKEVKWEQSPLVNGIGQLAIASDDSRVWDVLTKATKFAPLEQRVRFLEDLGFEFPLWNVKQQMRFLAQFLDDDLKWVEKKELPGKSEPSGPKLERQGELQGAKRRYGSGEMEVRNLAAMKLNELWGKPVECTMAEASDWQDFRKAVKARVDQEMKSK